MTRLLWLDLETTGLDPRKDLLLEVFGYVADLSDPFRSGLAAHAVISSGVYENAAGSVLVTQPPLDNPGRGLGGDVPSTLHSTLPWGAGCTASFYEIGGHRSGIVVDEFVRKMHTDNGLFEECRRSEVSIGMAEATFVELLLQRDPDEEKVVLAGSSVHFDLSFLRVHMPRLAAMLSHRVYDVSAISLFCYSLGMARLPKSTEQHRARGDVLASVEHAVRCRDWLASKTTWGEYAGRPAGRAGM